MSEMRASFQHGVIVVRKALGPALLVLWLAIMLAIKVAFYQRGIVIGDLFLYANALVNTRLPDQLLYVADYQLGRGATSLVLDHFGAELGIVR